MALQDAPVPPHVKRIPLGLETAGYVYMSVGFRRRFCSRVYRSGAICRPIYSYEGA
ncbi:hypothetical protein SAMN05421688_0883 [Poseidonocella pacifica]|uniref:Uncharacterized protein n=1 Tax=Poseidonocella pacifica TaxID=871651 RepID=A0A1I0VQG7_9RHOB|nr:hypothetical protein SAMN05421688_0883 [Poseidonocella pacifica]